MQLKYNSASYERTNEFRRLQESINTFDENLRKRLERVL